jgi:membrane protein
VAGVGVLALLSLMASVFVQAMGRYLGQFVSVPAATLEAINFAVTFFILSFLFALIYRIFPQTRVDWEDVAVGSVVTAALFTAGKFLVALYLGKAGVGSAYGAAGSLVVLLVWVYYSAQIFLYGAEFTHVFARRRRVHFDAQRDPLADVKTGTSTRSVSN